MDKSREQRHAEAQNRYIMRRRAGVPARSYQRRPHTSYSKHEKQRRGDLAALKTKPCKDCGGVWPPFAMDWDHVRGDKVLSVAMLVTTSIPWSLVLQELDKCDLVCASCHRVRTHSRIDAERERAARGLL